MSKQIAALQAEEAVNAALAAAAREAVKPSGKPQSDPQSGPAASTTPGGGRRVTLDLDLIVHSCFTMRSVWAPILKARDGVVPYAPPIIGQAVSEDTLSWVDCAQFIH